MIGVKEFAIPLALILILVLTYLLLLGKLNGWTFSTGLFAIAVLTGVVAVVIPRSEEVSEIGGKMGGAEVLVKMEKIQKEVYAKAEQLGVLAEKVGELTAFNLAHLGRFAPTNLDELLLQERDRLKTTLKEAGIKDDRVEEITGRITQVVARDVALSVWETVPKEIFGDKGPAKGQDINAVVEKLLDLLLNSSHGTARDTARSYLTGLGGWTSIVESRVREFEEFRQSGKLPEHMKEKKGQP